MKETLYKCPVCQGILVSQIGNVIHPGDPKFGVNIRCPHLNCKAQEVMGHGRTEKDAYEIVVSRFKGRI